MAGLGVSGLIMDPKDMRSTTWYLNKVRLRTCYHFLVMTRTEGRELRTKRGAKGWAGRAPKSEAEKIKFQELVLCPRSDRDQAVPRGEDDDDGLVFLQETAAAVKATTTASKNRNKFQCAGRDQGYGI